MSKPRVCYAEHNRAPRNLSPTRGFGVRCAPNQGQRRGLLDQHHRDRLLPDRAFPRPSTSATRRTSRSRVFEGSGSSRDSRCFWPSWSGSRAVTSRPETEPNQARTWAWGSSLPRTQSSEQDDNPGSDTHQRPDPLSHRELLEIHQSRDITRGAWNASARSGGRPLRHS